MTGASGVEARMQRFATNLNSVNEFHVDQAARLTGREQDEVAPVLAYLGAVYPEFQNGLTPIQLETSPDEADSVVARCPEIALVEAAIGTHSRERSVWFRGTHDFDLSLLGRITETAIWGGKPAKGGLFTSPTSAHGLGMWHLYLAANLGTYTPPWRAWRVEAASDARIRCLRSAREWCDFVVQYGRETAAGLTVNWPAAAEALDAVTIPIRTLAAIDCVGFVHEGTTIAPSYWGVETTLWLNPCFANVEEVVVSGTPPTRGHRQRIQSPSSD